MESRTSKTCASCSKTFVIEPADFAFYKNIGVPEPGWCPECRNMRRMSWREGASILYRDTCKLCGKSIVSVHAPDGPFTIYCRECYHSDKWNPLDYGRDYDFTKPFFVQYRELMEQVPRPALTGSNLVNSDFSHGCESVKNCYYVFWSYFSEHAQYCYALLLSKNSFDCYVVDNSDHVYQSLHSNRLYKVNYAYFSDDCLDASFLYDCVGLSDCFGCVNLRKQKYHIFNEKFSREEYRERMKYWDLGSYAKLEEAKSKFRELYLSLPHRHAHIVSSVDVTGDIIRDSKGCDTCFSALDGVENCKYLYFGGLNLKDSMDVSAGGDSSELIYETYAMTGQCSRCFFSAGGGNARDIWYSDWPKNASRLWGCVSIRDKQHCILNKQYSKKEYEALIPKIRQHMDDMPYRDKKGRSYGFGEFFPAELSAYAYNEAFGFQWYPKSKTEVIAEGLRWQDPPPRSYEITLQPEQIPDHIKDIDDSILDKIIGCAHRGTCSEHDRCTTAFRLSSQELSFYRSANLALPRLCPNCRHAERLAWRNGFELYRRRCSCNQGGHFHGGNPCPHDFETTFSPEKPEIIYCADCYKAEYV